MTDIERKVESYLQELESQLMEFPPSERKLKVAEVKHHLVSFVEEYKSKGSSEIEIQQKIEQEFLSPEEAAQKLSNESKLNTDSRFLNKYTLIIAAILVLLVSFVLPSNLKTVPLAVFLFVIAYFIFTKKLVWGFALVRHNQGHLKNRDTVARLGGIYVFIVGLVILLTNFIEALQTSFTFWVLVLGYVAYVGYIRKNIA